MGVIYKATCSINGKSYIGQTKNFERRKKEHLQATDNYVFHRAIRKYGKDNFQWEILEECDDSLLDEKEIYWIAYYNTYYNGYNLTLGGDNANALTNWIKKHPEEKHMHALNGLYYANQYNHTHPKEWQENLKKAQQSAKEAVSKSVRCIELNLIFNSISDAERWSLTAANPNKKIAHHQHISKVCSGLRHTAGGFHWEYV